MNAGRVRYVDIVFRQQNTPPYQPVTNLPKRQACDVPE